MSVASYCYTLLFAGAAVGSAARDASAPTEGGEGRGQIVAATRLQLVLTQMISNRLCDCLFNIH